MKKYKVQEIFYSLQGEGYWVGHPAVFIRFYGCNLQCSYCDTPQSEYKEMTAEQIWSEAEALRPQGSDVILCLTGGEPMLQVDVRFLKFNFIYPQFRLHLETNGTKNFTDEVKAYFSWIVVSPKRGHEVKVQPGFVNEVRFPYCREDEEYIHETAKLFPGHIYVSPIARQKELDREKADEAVRFCLTHPQFALSVQMHKVLDIK